MTREATFDVISDPDRQGPSGVIAGVGRPRDVHREDAQGGRPWIEPDLRIPILMWHKVDSRAPSRHWVTAAQFNRQLAALETHGFSPITLRTLYDFMTDKEVQLPPQPVVLTFDDGYQDFQTHAFPILEHYGFPAVVFIPTGKIGTTERHDNAWDAREACHKTYHLIWSEIEELSATGLVSFQSHTVTHADLEAPGTDVAWELAQARQDLAAHVAEPIDFFSYPYGSGADSAVVRDQVRQAGYKAAVAAWGEIEPLAAASVWALKRIEVARWHDTEGRVNPRHCFMRLLDPAFAPSNATAGKASATGAGGKV